MRALQRQRVGNEGVRGERRSASGRGACLRLPCSVRGGMRACRGGRAEAGGARRAPERERTWALSRGCFAALEAVAAEPGSARRVAQRERSLLAAGGAPRLSGVVVRCVYGSWSGARAPRSGCGAASGRWPCVPRLKDQEKDQDGQSDGRKRPRLCRTAVRAMGSVRRATRCA